MPAAFPWRVNADTESFLTDDESGPGQVEAPLNGTPIATGRGDGVPYSNRSSRPREVPHRCCNAGRQTINKLRQGKQRNSARMPSREENLCESSLNLHYTVDYIGQRERGAEKLGNEQPSFISRQRSHLEAIAVELLRRVFFFDHIEEYRSSACNSSHIARNPFSPRDVYRPLSTPSVKCVTRIRPFSRFFNDQMFMFIPNFCCSPGHLTVTHRAACLFRSHSPLYRNDIIKSEPNRTQRCIVSVWETVDTQTAHLQSQPQCGLSLCARQN